MAQNEKNKLTKKMVEVLTEEMQQKKEELARFQKKSRGEYHIVNLAETDESQDKQLVALEETLLLNSITGIQKILDNCEVVEIEEDKQTVSIGALVTLELTCEDETECFDAYLSADRIDLNSEIPNFTLNSPIGKCILGKAKDYIGKYTVGEGSAAKNYTCRVMDIQYA